MRPQASELMTYETCRNIAERSVSETLRVRDGQPSAKAKIQMRYVDAGKKFSNWNVHYSWYHIHAKDFLFGTSNHRVSCQSGFYSEHTLAM